jgi:hypothetical protein
VTLPLDADPKNVTAKFDKCGPHRDFSKPANMAAKSAKIPVKPD